MLLSPFVSLRPFSSHIHVALVGKEISQPSFVDCAQEVGASSFATLHQVHGNRTIVLRKASDRTEQADGMITDQPGLALISRAADCQPFVIYAPSKKILGVLHVGWRGMLAGAITEFFHVLQQEFEITGKETIVCAGPSLGTECAHFSDPTNELAVIDTKFIHGNQVDLMGAADAEFSSLGVAHIERPFGCTCCQPEKYWTYRGGDKEAVKAGAVNMVVCGLRS
ncbi:MAG: polyphenol oxidase family protein [Candidatus Peregrinibacteria bacterium]